MYTERNKPPLGPRVRALARAVYVQWITSKESLLMNMEGLAPSTMKGGYRY